VLLNGGGFEAPDWSLRVSLANLPDDVYDDIGRGVRSVARSYRDAFEASKKRAQDLKCLRKRLGDSARCRGLHHPASIRLQRDHQERRTLGLGGRDSEDATRHLTGFLAVRIREMGN
jgi:hypothetical protein